MKKYLFSFLTLGLLFLLSCPGAFAAEADKHAEQTRQYKKQLNEWAKGAKEAREKAREAYENVTFEDVHAQVKTGSASVSGYLTLKISFKVKNRNSFPVVLNWIEYEYADKNHNPQGDGFLAKNIRINGDSSYSHSEEYLLRGVYDEFANDLKSGKASVKLSISHLAAQGSFEGSILSDGSPFKGKRPRDPYWLSSDELRYIKGEADSNNGIYEAAPPLPIIGGWFPIHSSSGSFSGKLPKMEEPRKRSQKEITNDFLKKSRETLGYADDTAKETKDTGDSIQDVHDSIKGVLDLFN